MSSSLNGDRLTGLPASASWASSAAVAQLACTTCRSGPSSPSAASAAICPAAEGGPLACTVTGRPRPRAASISLR